MTGPERYGGAVLDGHPTEPTWYANTVRVARYGADFQTIQSAVDYCDSQGGLWIIELYTYGTGVWDEGDITPAGTSIITLRGMSEHVFIAPTVAPATAVVNITETMYLENITVISPDAAIPAVLVNTAAGAPTMMDCAIVGEGVGYSLQMTQGSLNVHRTAFSGDVHLSTARCLLDCFFTTFLGDLITAAEALNHDIDLMSCEFTGGNITSLATGATVLAIEGGSDIGTITDSGTGLFTVKGSYVDSVSCLDAGGEVRVRGGTLNSVTRAVGSVVWWKDDSTIQVLPSGTITDGVIGYALVAAGAGKIVIRLAVGDYGEDNLTAVDDVQIVGEGHTAPSGSHITINSANPIFTCGAAQMAIRHVRITQAGAGAVFVINDAAGVIHTDSCVIGSTGGNAITMTAGTYSQHDSTINSGNINLSTAACTLTLHEGGLGGDIITAGAFAHAITLSGVDVNGNNITNGATGATIIAIESCFGINALTDAGTAGTISIEASIIVTATKTGTSPWLVRIAEFGTLSNHNAAGAITCFGGTIIACGGSTGAITWQVTVNHFECVPGMNINHSIGAGRYIFLNPGTYTMVASLALASNLTIEGSRQSVITTSTANLDIITGSGLTGVTLKGFQVDGDLGGVACDMGIYLVNVDESKLVDLYIQDCGEDGIMLEDCDRTEVQHTYSDNSTEHGLYLLSCIRCKVIGGYYNNNTLDGVHIAGDATGNADYNTLEGVDATGNGSDGVEISEAGAGQANKNIVLGCQLLGNTGVNLNDGGTNTEQGHNITV